MRHAPEDGFHQACTVRGQAEWRLDDVGCDAAMRIGAFGDGHQTSLGDVVGFLNEQKGKGPGRGRSGRGRGHIKDTITFLAVPISAKRSHPLHLFSIGYGFPVPVTAHAPALDLPTRVDEKIDYKWCNIAIPLG